MDKLLTVLEEALEAGGYNVETVVDDETQERDSRRLTERFISSGDQQFILTVEIA